MSVYITTNKDINKDKPLLKTVCTLNKDDVIVMLSFDIEHSPESINYLQNEAKKKGVILKQCTLTERPYSDENMDFNTKCSMAIQHIADNYLDKNGERKLIFVGYTIVPIMLSLYQYLRERNITVESRMLGFNPGRTLLTEHDRIEEYYKKWQKATEKEEKSKKKKEKKMEIMTDKNGDQNVVIRHTVIIKDDEEEDVEIVGVEENEDPTEEPEETESKESTETESEEIATEETTTEEAASEEEQEDTGNETVDTPEETEAIEEEPEEKEKKEEKEEKKGKQKRKFFNNPESGIGKAAGKPKLFSKKPRFEDSAGNQIAQPRSRAELEDSIFKSETQEESKETEFSDELILRLQKYEQMIEKETKYFCKELDVSSINDKDFYTMVNLIQMSETKEDLVKNLSVELPLLEFSKMTDAKFQDFKKSAQKITDETNKFSFT